MMKKKLLLTAVFGPYGVKDKYAEGIGMQMEIVNNQITREQGVHSFRANYPSYGLYMLAENISVPTVVLDFPKWKDFVKELKKGYAYVGISFIIPNVLKAKRMVEYVRKNYPQTKIILGGFGTLIPEIKNIIPCEEICYGEGINWLRNYFGEDTNKPIKQTFMFAAFNRHVYGYSPSDCTVAIFPGLGCKNKCPFCVTSHNFGGYIPFIRTGTEIFAACQEAEKRTGLLETSLIDENFLKDSSRARDLLMEMEKHAKPYKFSIFSSAETIIEVGVDFLVRLGVVLVWIGVESKRNIFKKTENVDIHSLIKELRSKGIRVIASSILFLEYHDKQSLKEDIDWAIGLEADMNQFAALTPQPGTPLYIKYKNEGRLIKDFPYTKLTGMDRLSFKHPHFNSDEASEITQKAFRKKYLTHGPALLNVALTSLKGYKKAEEDFKTREKEKFCWNPETLHYEKTKDFHPDNFMKLRIEIMRKEALVYRPIILATKVFAPNKASRRKSDMTVKLYNEVFGRPTLKEKVKSMTLVVFAGIEVVRIKIRKLFGKGDIIHQPPTMRTEYFNRKPVS